MTPRTRKFVLALGLVSLGALGLLIADSGATRNASAEQNRAQPAPVAKATLSVSVVRPQSQEWPVQLTANGHIAAWQEALVSAETGGLRIVALHADVGSQVKRGELLVELAHDTVSAEIKRYEAALTAAKASLAQARANADRARQVKDTGVISEQQISDYLATAETAQANVALAEAQLDVQKVTLGQTAIVAVDDGIITARSASLGQVVATGSELFRLQRQGRLEWQAEVDARQLDQIRTGARAEVVLPSGKTLAGTVRLATPTLSTSTSRAMVYVTLPPDDDLKAGMLVSGHLEAGTRRLLSVPESALVWRDGRTYLFEVGQDAKATRRPVTVGMHREGLAEVGGVKADAAVVLAGGAFLADGDSVSIVKEDQR